MRELRLSPMEKRIEDILNKDPEKKVCVHISRISQDDEKQYPEFDAAHKILESLLEEWNEAHPDMRLSEEIIGKIWTSLRLAYVAGMEDYMGYIREVLIRFTNENGYVKMQVINEQINKI